MRMSQCSPKLWIWTSKIIPDLWFLDLFWPKFWIWTSKIIPDHWLIDLIWPITKIPHSTLEYSLSELYVQYVSITSHHLWWKFFDHNLNSHYGKSTVHSTPQLQSHWFWLYRRYGPVSVDCTAGTVPLVLTVPRVYGPVGVGNTVASVSLLATPQVRSIWYWIHHRFGPFETENTTGTVLLVLKTPQVRSFWYWKHHRYSPFVTENTTGTVHLVLATPRVRSGSYWKDHR